jgi:uncharacterized membrane protein
MKKIPRLFWTLAIVEACIVAAVFGWRFYVGTSAYLGHPTDGDVYAHDWSFQAVVFSLYAVPLFLIIMAVLLGLDWFALRLIKTDRKPRT